MGLQFFFIKKIILLLLLIVDLNLVDVTRK
jgi:hypothetical protein